MRVAKCKTQWRRFTGHLKRVGRPRILFAVTEDHHTIMVACDGSVAHSVILPISDECIYDGIRMLDEHLLDANFEDAHEISRFESGVGPQMAMKIYSRLIRPCPFWWRLIGDSANRFRSLAQQDKIVKILATDKHISVNHGDIDAEFHIDVSMFNATWKETRFRPIRASFDVSRVSAALRVDKVGTQIDISFPEFESWMSGNERLMACCPMILRVGAVDIGPSMILQIMPNMGGAQ